MVTFGISRHPAFHPYPYFVTHAPHMHHQCDQGYANLGFEE
jgi:hypothetical protein